MNVNETAETIDRTDAISARFTATEPEYAGKNPVTFRISGGQVWRKDLAGGTPAHEYRVQRLARAYHGADIMSATGSTAATIPLASTIQRGGYREYPGLGIGIFQKRQGLTFKTYLNG